MLCISSYYNKKLRLTLLNNFIAEKLDMDHVYISFTSFLWAKTFVGINAFMLNIKGTLGLLFRKKLHQLKLISLKPFVPEELVGKLLLEGKKLSE